MIRDGLVIDAFLLALLSLMLTISIEVSVMKLLMALNTLGWLFIAALRYYEGE